MISDNTLEVLKALVRLALLREQDIMFYGALQKNSKYKKLISELLCNPPDDLMEAIQLHRVATILEGEHAKNATCQESNGSHPQTLQRDRIKKERKPHRETGEKTG